VLGAAASLACTGGCESPERDENRAHPTPEKAKAPTAVPPATVPPATVTNKPTPRPTVNPPPAPEGTIALKAAQWIYVQTCERAAACPALLQPVGEQHCRQLSHGGRDNWRLPSRREAEAFAGITHLRAAEGYHWTRTPYDEDIEQVWIVDPAGAQPTTLPRTRKPLTVRCVSEV